MAFIPQIARASSVVNDNYLVIDNKLVLSDDYQKDLIAIGDEVEISGRVSGDLFVVANTANISGIVEGDVWFAVGQIDLSSQVAGSVRGLADKAVITGSIGQNLFVKGGRMIEAVGNVGWDIYIDAYQIKLGGQARRADIKVNNLQVEGQFEYLVVKSENKTANIKIGDSAQIGELSISSVVNPIIVEGSQIGKTNIVTIPDLKLFYSSLFKWIVSVFSLLAVGLLLFYLTRHWLQHSAELLSEEVGKNFIWGFAWIVLTPLLVFVLFLTTIGIPLALMLGGVWLSGFYLAQVLFSFWLGRFVYFRLRNKPVLTPEDYTPSSLTPLVVGVILFKMIAALPVIGWIFLVLSVAVASGSGVRVLLSYIKE